MENDEIGVIFIIRKAARMIKQGSYDLVEKEGN